MQSFLKFLFHTFVGVLIYQHQILRQNDRREVHLNDGPTTTGKDCRITMTTSSNGSKEKGRTTFSSGYERTRRNVELNVAHYTFRWKIIWMEECKVWNPSLRRMKNSEWRISMRTKAETLPYLLTSADKLCSTQK